MVGRLRIRPDAFADAEVYRVAGALRAGGVIAYPTDTLYGLGADPRVAGGVNRIFDIKGRPAGQALPLIAADVPQAQSVARFPPAAARLAARFWPGPLTLVLECGVPLAAGVAAEDGTIAIRVPDHPLARAIARVLDHPITATSANRSGEPPTDDPSVVEATLGDRIVLLVDGGRSPGGLPSTIVHVTTESPALVRAGAIAWDRVLESLE